MSKNQQLGTDFVDALPSDGERRLMLAVLIDAIRVVAQDPPAARLRAHRAWLCDRAWLQSDDHMRPFSFVNICTALGFNADYIRRSVLHLAHCERRLRLHRYAAKVEESWIRQSRPIAKTSSSARDMASPRAGAAS